MNFVLLKSYSLALVHTLINFSDLVMHKHFFRYPYIPETDRKFKMGRQLR